MNRNKLIVVLGPTACGKTKLAARLAVRFNGEIISADSRQVYKGMDIGTGKDLKDYVIKSKVKNIQISHHLIDIIKPMTSFDVVKYQRLAYKAIDDVLRRGKVPILTGGTGLYIKSITDGYQFNVTKCSRSKVQSIRKKLDRPSLKQLLTRLKKIDLKTYKIIDRQNRRRVQRALEIYYETGVPKSQRPQNKKPPYQILTIGIKYSLEKIYRKIDKRLDNRFKEGMIREVKKLRRSGVTWKRLNGFGLEYRWISLYLQKKISQVEMIERLKNDIHHFAKRQLTWFKRDKNIKWVTSYSVANQSVRQFLKD